MPNRLKIATLSFTAALALAGVVALLWLLGSTPSARADSPHRVAPNCTGVPAPCHTSIQAAVDAASPGDEIRVVAGTYIGVQGRTAPGGYPNPPASGIITQVVYISKTVTIRGGYTTTDWITPYPITQPTTLDAQGQGRVILITGDISPTIEGLHITGGGATGLGGTSWGRDAGGGVYIISAMAMIGKNWVFSNTAEDGGGLFLSSSAVTLRESTVMSNTADSGGGGGLFSEGSAATLNDNIVTSNAAVYGGGLCIWRGATTLNANTVTSNTAVMGGGLYLEQSDATLSGNTIISNIANCGGGLFVWSGVATLNADTITSNTANGANHPWDGGGGLFLLGSDATLTNAVVTDNEAGTAGSGLYVCASSSHLLHTTIACNRSSDGSGVYVTNSASYYSTVALTNTILVGHSVGISVTGGNTVTVNSILWYGTPITVSQATTATVAVQHQYQGDPLFAADGYHLTSASTAAIDKGVDAGVTTDIDGDWRDAAPDLGADEFAFSPGGNKLYLPIIMKGY